MYFKNSKPEETQSARKDLPHVPWWLIGLGFVFPPAWPFLIGLYIVRYPKTAVTATVSAGLLVFIVVHMSTEDTRRKEEAERARFEKEERLLPTCLEKYGKSLNASPGNECYSILVAHESDVAAETRAATSMAKSTAESSCRRAVKESLTTLDGYHIPFGTVVTAPHAGHPGQFVTKFPFTVKNAFGVRMNHGVECVASGNGDVVEVNQLF